MYCGPWQSYFTSATSLDTLQIYIILIQAYRPPSLQCFELYCVIFH